MKNIYNKSKILLLSFGMIIISCSEDNLDINPADQYSIETFWVTQEHANAGLTGTYQVLNNLYGGSWIFETDMVTPNAWGYNENGSVGPLARGVQLTTDPTILGRWKVCYSGIGRANTFLDKVNKVTMDANLKLRMIGEAKFLRGMYYFHLIDYLFY